MSDVVSVGVRKFCDADQLLASVPLRADTRQYRIVSLGRVGEVTVVVPVGNALCSNDAITLVTFGSVPTRKKIVTEPDGPSTVPFATVNVGVVDDTRVLLVGEMGVGVPSVTGCCAVWNV